MTKEKMERAVLEKSWMRNGPVGPSLEVIDDDDVNDINCSNEDGCLLGCSAV
jgi:hypothetical protein